MNTFGFLDYIKNPKLLSQPVGIPFRVAALLHNAHVCLNKPLVRQDFEIRDVNAAGLARAEELIQDQLLEPPTLFEYFHN